MTIARIGSRGDQRAHPTEIGAPAQVRLCAILSAPLYPRPACMPGAAYRLKGKPALAIQTGPCFVGGLFFRTGISGVKRLCANPDRLHNDCLEQQILHSGRISAILLGAKSHLLLRHFSQTYRFCGGLEVP